MPLSEQASQCPLFACDGEMSLGVDFSVVVLETDSKRLLMLCISNNDVWVVISVQLRGHKNRCVFFAG